MATDLLRTLRSSSSASPVSEGVIREVFRSFGQSGATGAILEHDYFDLDYRSEFSHTHETSFQARSPETSRLHFFAADRPPGRSVHMRDYVEKNATTYLGYIVLRPQVPGRVGRSIIPATGSLFIDGVEIDRATRVRTAVPEYLELFGVSLKALGVPFMEQDGRLLRCAHVSAWICHYTSTLRGVTPRAASAQFHRAGGDLQAYGRPYPSDGFTSGELSRVLGALGLPPEVIGAEHLGARPPVNWWHRRELHSTDAPHEDAEPTNSDRIWVRESLTANVCRYLNSGIPVILARESSGHTAVVVGYVRDFDLGNSSLDQLHSDVVKFIVHDDQKGPYIAVDVDDLVNEILAPDDEANGTEYSQPVLEGEVAPDSSMFDEVIGMSLVVPLPPGLWLNGGVAEAAGALHFGSACEQRLAEFDTWTNESRLSDAAKAASREGLEAAVAGVAGQGDGLAARSYAINGSDFKTGFASRLLEADKPSALGAVRLLGHLRLPRYVWVVEVLSRELRKGGTQSVIGTVVLDATLVADRPSRLADVTPLFIHLPGQASGFSVKEWTAAPAVAYSSGRWHHEADWFTDARAIASHSKSATGS